jgi:hypothetical protein
MSVKRLFRGLGAGCGILGVIAFVGVGSRLTAQVALNGLDITPTYEGWEQNPDGSFNLVFGYFNRNWDEALDIPVGPDNNIEPGGPDQGQPTHFFPRQSRFVVRIRVPSDFGKKELMWTLTAHGKTNKAYATLIPDYFIDDTVIQNNNGGGIDSAAGAESMGNKAPVLKVEGKPSRMAKAGQAVTLTAFASDDGKPKNHPMPPPLSPAALSQAGTPSAATGLRLSWFVYRGAGNVTFDPPQFEAWEDLRDGRNSPWSPGWVTPPIPPDGKWITKVTFSEPGTYVLRCLAHDGGLSASEDVTLVVSR